MALKKRPRTAKLADAWLTEPLEGRYALRRVVAEGTTTRVYCGDDLALGDAVAVKRILAPELNARFLWRFRAAAYALAIYPLPHCIPVRDYALIGSDAMVVMSWQPTPTLGTHLRARSRLPVTITSQLALWLAEALADLHSHDLLHLGLTPNNIFLDRQVGVKVADAGLARLLSDTGLTMTGGNLTTTLPYLAPEQIAYTPLSPATDVYAFGVILYQTLTGVTPYPQRTLAEYMAALASQEHGATPRPSQRIQGIPPALDDVIAACLNHDPQRRPRDGAALVERLREANVADVTDMATVQMYVTHATTQHRIASLKLSLTRRRQRATAGEQRQKRGLAPR